MIPESAIENVLSKIDPQAVVDLAARLVRCNSVWDPRAGTSETEAAVKNGITGLCIPPDTQPPIDNSATVELIHHRNEMFGHVSAF